MKENRRKRVSVSDPMAPVRLSPVRVNGHEVTNQGVEIQLSDGSWQAINIHSADYNLVANSEAEKVTQQILSESALEWKQEKEVWTGRYWACLYKADTSVEVPSVNEILSTGFRVENSYDGSSQFRLVLMGYVLACSNGLISPQCFSSYTMRHTKNNDFNIDGAVRVLSSGMDEVQALVPKIDRLSQIPLTFSLLSDVARKTGLPSGEWGHIVKDLGEASTAWDLMQVITHRLTHFGKGRAGIQHQEVVGDYFLSHLSA